MIVKIKNKNKWRYYDVKTFEVSRPNYALVRLPNKSVRKGNEEHIELGNFEVVLLNDKKEPVLNSILHVHDKLWDEDTIIPSKKEGIEYKIMEEPDEPDKIRRWGIKLFKMYFNEFDDEFIVVTPQWNDDCFLINENGKTIERI